MVEPITVGSLVALALSAATEAVVKGTVEEATKDAYHALKQKLSQLAFGDVQALEKSPSSISKQFVVAEIIDAQSKDNRESLRILAEALIIALNKHLSADDLVVSKE